MKSKSYFLFLLSAQLLAFNGYQPENGNLISEPSLSDYSRAQRAPGIMGAPEEVMDAEGNPVN